MSEKGSDHYKIIFEASPDALFIVNKTGVIQSMNKQAEILFGYAVDELIGKQIEQLIPEESQSVHKNRRAKYGKNPVTRRMGTTTTDFIAIKKGNIQFPVAISLSPATLQDGKEVTIAAIREISHRKANEEKLRNYFEIVNNVHEAIIRLDTDRNILGWNKAAENLFGYTEDEIMAIGIEAIIPINEKERTQNIIEKVLQGAVFKDVEVVRLNKNKKLLELTTSVIPVKSASGEISGIISISSEHSSEKEALIVRKKLADLVRHSSEAIVIYNLEGHILNWNTGATEVFGYSEKEALTMDLEKFLPTGEKEKANQRLNDLKLGKYFKNIEGQRRHKSGKTITITYSVFPMYDELGKVNAVASISRDTTALKKYREQLEEEVRVKTKELNNTIIQLRKSGEELSNFTYAASHDLKSPLRAISHLTTFIQADIKKDISDSSREYFGIIHSRVARMEQLIDGLILLSSLKIDPNNFEYIDTKKLIDEIIRSMDFKREYEIKTAGIPAAIRFDKRLLKMVFTNLISNGIIHNNNEGLATILIRCEQEEDYTIWHVVDNGPGISNVDCEKIFKIFQTLQNTVQDFNIGLGLSITRKIVEDAGGYIKVSSQPGEGAVFTFAIPRGDVFR